MSNLQMAYLLLAIAALALLAAIEGCGLRRTPYGAWETYTLLVTDCRVAGTDPPWLQCQMTGQRKP